MVRLIIFVLCFLFANTAYFGGDLLFALGFLKIWYWLILIPMLFLTGIQLLIYFKVITNPRSIIITNNEMPKQKVFNIIYSSLNKGIKTLIFIVGIIAFQLILTYFLIGTIPYTAVGFSFLTIKSQIAFVILIAINLYYFIKGLKYYF